MARVSALVLCACVLLAASGCKKDRGQPQQRNKDVKQPALKAAPATPIQEKKQELGGKTWDPQWDVLVEKALPPEMLSSTAARAVRSYCPRFAELGEADKRAFWAYTFQAIAGAEAGLDPTTNVHHTEAAVNVTDGVTLRPVRQQGLLQLTYEDARRYGCDFDWKRDRRLREQDPNKSILQPGRNLACGVKIMERQIIRQRKPLIVSTSYWSTLQPGTASYKVFAKQMTNVPAVCGVGVRQIRKRRPARAQHGDGGVKIAKRSEPVRPAER